MKTLTVLTMLCCTAYVAEASGSGPLLSTNTSVASDAKPFVLNLSSSIIGTWQLVRIDQNAVDEPFYMRFYRDGKCATWPAPDGFSTINGVSRGRYHIEEQFLVSEGRRRKDDVKVKVEIINDEMTVHSSENDEDFISIYHRVIPDLNPEKFQPDQVRHGAPPF